MRADPRQIAARAPGFLARIASVVGGVLILKHEVYDTEEAELFVIALGLWLIGIPPALWLDTLRRTTTALDPGREDPGDRRASRSSKRRRGD